MIAAERQSGNIVFAKSRGLSLFVKNISLAIFIHLLNVFGDKTMGINAVGG